MRLEHARGCDFVVLNARKTMLRQNAAAWRIFTTQKPLFAIRKQGVLLAGVYPGE